MIFLTVGTQLPFDRLTAAIDDWAAHNIDIEVFGQIGLGEYIPRHIQYRPFITPQQAEQRFLDSELVVAHAGMGSIITALKHNKPIIVVPRRSSLGEHRNDHQLATVKRLSRTEGLFCVDDIATLPKLLDERQALRTRGNFSPFAPIEFTERLRLFIDGSP